MTAKISVFNPTAGPAGAQQQKRRALDSLQGKVVGFIDNSKANFNYLVDDMAALLESRHGVKTVIKHRKRAATMAATEDVVSDLAARCDVVITGSGD